MYAREPLDQRFKKLTVVTKEGCWEWQAERFKRGYGRMKIAQGNGVYKPRHAHRVSYEFFKGSIPKGAFVLHDCHNRACVNPEHLHLGDHADNMRERDEAGRTRKGAQVYNFVRNEENCTKAADLRDMGMSVRDICKTVGISYGTYYQMRRDGHVTKERKYARVAT